MYWVLNDVGLSSNGNDVCVAIHILSTRSYFYITLTFLPPTHTLTLTHTHLYSIEYGDMQLIAEVYDVLKQTAGLTNEELSQVTCMCLCVYIYIYIY